MLVNYKIQTLQNVSHLSGAYLSCVTPVKCLPVTCTPVQCLPVTCYTSPVHTDYMD